MTADHKRVGKHISVVLMKGGRHLIWDVDGISHFVLMQQYMRSWLREVCCAYTLHGNLKKKKSIWARRTVMTFGTSNKGKASSENKNTNFPDTELQSSTLRLVCIQ